MTLETLSQPNLGSVESKDKNLALSWQENKRKNMKGSWGCGRKLIHFLLRHKLRHGVLFNLFFQPPLLSQLGGGPLAYLWPGSTDLQGKISRDLKKWTAGANWRVAGLSRTLYSVAHTSHLQEASLEAGGASGSFMCAAWALLKAVLTHQGLCEASRCTPKQPCVLLPCACCWCFQILLRSFVHCLVASPLPGEWSWVPFSD